VGPDHPGARRGNERAQIRFATRDRAHIAPAAVRDAAARDALEEARTLIETAIDQYENVLLDASIASSRKAAEKDPHSALAYAVWSFAARRGEPAPEALQRAKSLASRATPDERLLVDWMLDVQQGSMLPAIRTMNDLLSRFPKDKHILYLTSEWLYFQQDYDRSRKMMEKILELDPNFAPALNMLGYANIEAGEPNPDRAHRIPQALCGGPAATAES